MRNDFRYILIGLSLLMLVFAGCDTATQEPSPIVSPDGYPVATFATDFTGSTVNEGDTLVYTITFNEMIDRSVTFNFKQTGGTAEADHDYVVEPGTLAPYTLETTMKIIFPTDDIPETEDLTLLGEIWVPSLADRYLVNPSVDFPELNLTLKSVNDPTLLTIMFGWDSEDDIDIVIWSNTDAYPMTPWSDQGATVANPEFDKAIWLADPPGTYYVNIMHWGAPSFNYTFTLGHPDQSVQVITGTFDSDNLQNYTLDPWTAWGGSYDSYRILTVVNDGSKFTVTPL
ncbi:MAG: hypothetical protein JXR52_02640 [Bacteroidales bacterium]|nr:hypothetical protein [Bacteroidales bacterium]